MIENDLKTVIEYLDTDPFTDKRIIDKLLSYDEQEACNPNISWVRGIYNKTIFRNFSRVASIIVILAVIGVATALASSYRVKSYPIKFEKITREEHEAQASEEGYIILDLANPDVKKHFRGGRKIYDQQGLKPIGYKIGEENYPDTIVTILDNSSIYPGKEAFGEVGFPDLTPTRIIDRYILDADGYIYRKQEYKNLEGGVIVAEKITATFHKYNSPMIYLTFTPFDVSLADISNLSLLDREPIDVIYTTDSGLICNIRDFQDPNHWNSAYILFDSETYGNASYELEFKGDISIDEIKAILESIPLSSDMLETGIKE